MPIPSTARDHKSAPAMATGMLCAVNTRRADWRSGGEGSIAARTWLALAAMKRSSACQSPTYVTAHPVDRAGNLVLAATVLAYCVQMMRTVRRAEADRPSHHPAPLFARLAATDAVPSRYQDVGAPSSRAARHVTCPRVIAVGGDMPKLVVLARPPVVRRGRDGPVIGQNGRTRGLLVARERARR